MELRHSQLIILWGTNTKLTNRHLWPTIEAARADGAQVVVIDPIRTMTADDADWFIQPLPGTDIALMLAMMHVLIRDGLDRPASGSPSTPSASTSSPPTSPSGRRSGPRRPAASTPPTSSGWPRMYGTIRPAAIRTLVGAEHHENGAMFFRTLACLPALVGAWSDRGGGLARSVGVWTRSVVDGAALQRARPARRTPAAVGEHEPPRRGARPRPS